MPMKPPWYATLTLLALGLALSACSPKPISRLVLSYGLDFTPYTQNGFLFTPNEYLGEHESIGILTVEIRPAARVERNTQAELKSEERRSGNVVYERVWASDGIDKLYRDALALGADAVTQIIIEPIPAFYHGVEITGVRVTGFAIDRSNVGL